MIEKLHKLRFPATAETAEVDLNCGLSQAYLFLKDSLDSGLLNFESGKYIPSEGLMEEFRKTSGIKQSSRGPIRFQIIEEDDSYPPHVNECIRGINAFFKREGLIK